MTCGIIFLDERLPMCGNGYELRTDGFETAYKKLLMAAKEDKLVLRESADQLALFKSHFAHRE